MKLDDGARDWLGNEGYDPVYGARPLKRVIQRSLQNELAELIGAIESVDGNDIAGANQVIFDLVLMLSRREPSEIVGSRAQFEKWTRQAKRSIDLLVDCLHLIHAATLYWRTL